MYNAQVRDMGEAQEAQREFFVKVYGWMALALALTGLVAMQVAASPVALSLIFGNPLIFYGLIIGELILVMVLSAGIQKMSPAVAMSMFFVYAAVNGLTLSVIFLAYTKGSIASTFFVTGGTFAAMSLYGYTTKKDLSGWGSFLFMALIGMIIASVVNIFLHSPILYWITTYAGVLIFTGLTAYDTNRLKQICGSLEAGSEAYVKVAIIGALQLYLDFINLFLLLLRLMGRRK